MNDMNNANEDLLFSSAYARLLSRSGIPGLGEISQAALLEDTALTEEQLHSTNYLKWSQARRMLVNIEAAGAKADWPIGFANQLGPSSHGPLGFAAISAATLGDALKVLAQYHATRTATLDFRLLKDSDFNSQANSCAISIDDLTCDPHYGRQILEMSIKAVLTIIETIVGHPLMHNVSVQFVYPAPAYAKKLNAGLEVDCQFNCATNAIIMPASWLDIVSPLYDESTYRANIVKCREQLAALYAIKKDPALLIKERLAQCFDQMRAEGEYLEKLPDLEQCATELALSTRTLIRRLQLENTSYKKILEQVRSEYAADLLTTTHLSANDIGLMLAYSDPSNFIRAFKQWYGITPSNWRKRKS